MKRTIGLSALLAGALLSAGSLSAQSDNSGFMLNLHLLGNGVSGVGADAEMENGGGLGVRMNFGNEGMKLRPYINAAFSGLVLGEEGELAGEEIVSTISGGGLTVGGGLQYFFSQNLALDVGLQATQGAFTDVAVDDEDEELDEGIAYTTSRIQLGVTWHP